jgi:hypothetical protein
MEAALVEDWETDHWFYNRNDEPVKVLIRRSWPGCCLSRGRIFNELKGCATSVAGQSAANSLY